MTIAALSGDECRDLLAANDIGRLSVVIGGFPEVFPANYARPEMLERDRHDEELEVAAARIESWAGSEKAHVLVVTPVSVTGRRILSA